MTSETARIFAAVITANDLEHGTGKQEPNRSLHVGSAATPGPGELIVHQFDIRDLLSDPVAVVTLDRRNSLNTSFHRRLEFQITRAGDAFGVALWSGHNSGGGDSVEISPGEMDSNYPADNHRQVMISWPAIVNLVSGDYVRVNLRADRLSDECDWYWDSLIRKIENGKIQGIRYQQCTACPLPVFNRGQQ